MVFVLARLIGLSPSSPQPHAGLWATQAPFQRFIPCLITLTVMGQPWAWCI
ncbi:MAG: hypothetical protein KUF75_05820 [Candidatus Thiodiazotropha sp. (ex Ctena orbiculata)]|nr:hypothetical protein [Candidatus Thiodiazotropha taylori]